MRVLRLMRELESLYEQCGNVEVRVVSDDYCLSIHSIADVRSCYCRECRKSLDYKRKALRQKAKEVLKMAEMSYTAAIGAYRNIGKMFENCKQNLIEQL